MNWQGIAAAAPRINCLTGKFETFGIRELTTLGSDNGFQAASWAYTVEKR